MKNTTLVLLCCSAFLAACDNSSDTSDSVVESAKETASDAMDAAKEAATDDVAAGKDLKDTAVESAGAAVDSVKEKSDDVIASVTGDDSSKGESVYKKHCVACHGTGVAGSPKLGDKAAWSTRITQGDAVLTQHAIKGFKGETGYMPPKGGFMSLSDDEISVTVQYMVSQAQ